MTDPHSPCQQPQIAEASAIKEALRFHPEALLVLISRGVPATAAAGTIADAARACGRSPKSLLSEILAAVSAAKALAPSSCLVRRSTADGCGS